ncbi:MAG: hypothetical protein QOE90_931 [Thermoplasmata archaeon]|jgi:hypothetical protein|nr:hypothetical protein [Thermoplasmata archaeon]
MPKKNTDAEDARRIKELAAAGKSQRQIMRETRRSLGFVNSVCTGKKDDLLSAPKTTPAPKGAPKPPREEENERAGDEEGEAFTLNEPEPPTGVPKPKKNAPKEREEEHDEQPDQEPRKREYRLHLWGPDA